MGYSLSLDDELIIQEAIDGGSFAGQDVYSLLESKKEQPIYKAAEEYFWISQDNAVYHVTENEWENTGYLLFANYDGATVEYNFVQNDQFSMEQIVYDAVSDPNLSIVENIYQNIVFYGNYCGPGLTGGEDGCQAPKDAIDVCCALHDKFYSHDLGKFGTIIADEILVQCSTNVEDIFSGTPQDTYADFVQTFFVGKSIFGSVYNSPEVFMEILSGKADSDLALIIQDINAMFGTLAPCDTSYATATTVYVGDISGEPTYPGV